MSVSRLKRALLALLLAAGGLALGARETPGPNGARPSSIALRTGSVDLASAKERVANRRTPASRDELPRLLLVKLETGTGKAFRGDVLAGGGQVVGYIPDDTVMVWGPPGLMEDAASKHGANMADFAASQKAPGELRRVARDARTRARARKGKGPSAAGRKADPDLDGFDTWQETQAAGGSSGRKLQETSSQPLYGINVQIVNVLPYSARQTIAEQWPGLLATALGRTNASDSCKPTTDNVLLLASGPPWLRVFMCPEDMELGLQWLLDRAETIWAEPIHRVEAFNARAGWTLQTGSLSSDRFSYPISMHKPFWRAGVMGNREIVMVGDSGLDVAQCYFVDSAYDPLALYNGLDGSASRPSWLVPDARKVIHYRAANGKTQYTDESGHGTHVTGSVAGVAGDGSTSFREDEGAGAAPMAKISMCDCGVAGGGLSIPTPYESEFYGPHVAVGASITTNSWGVRARSAISYGWRSNSFDRYLWKNPYILHLHAAGNNGNGAEMGNTVSEDSLGKNVLSIGASENYPESGGFYSNTMLFRYTNGTTTYTDSFYPYGGAGWDAWYSIVTSAAGGRLSVALASPENGCGTLVGTYTGRAVLMDLNVSACGLWAKTQAAANAGAVGVLFYRTDDDYAFWDSTFSNLGGTFPTNWTTSTVKGVAVTNRHAQWMKNALALSGADLHIYVPSSADPLVLKVPGVMSDFSSYGPAFDGRIKPDLVAPGTNIMSAKMGSGVLSRNSSTCDAGLTNMQGTSMATPLAAGHFALMRQYFRQAVRQHIPGEGFYPAGSRGSLSANFTPTAMLLKATAIAGATSLQGQLARNMGRLMGPSPDGLQGWGRLNLAGSLPLPGLTPTAPNGMALQVADGGTIAEGQTITLTGLRSTGGAISASLVWNDFPADPVLSKHLINDLDLYYSLNGDTTKRFTLGDPWNASSPDRTNSVERIQLTLSAGDAITFHVVGFRFGSNLLTSDTDASLPQRWALAVVGRFTGALQTTLNPAFAQPQRLPAFQLQTLVPLSHSISLAGGACLSSSGSAAVASSTCAAGASTVFTITEEGQPFTRIRTGTSGSLCLTIPGNSQANGVQLQHDTCSTGDGQSLYLEGVTGDSGYRVKTTAGKCVSVAGAATAAGSTVVLGDCLSDGGAHQRFVLTEYAQGFWTLAPKHAPCMCLSVSGAAGSGATMEACVAYAASQRFRLADIPAPGVPSSQGYRYVVRESVSGQCLTVAGSSSGSPATLAACDGSSAQRMLVFRNPYSADPNAFQLVPLPTFNKSSTSGRLCLQHTALGSPLSLASCDADVAGQTITVVEAPPPLRLTVEWKLPNDPMMVSFRLGANAKTAGSCLAADSTTKDARISAITCNSASSLQQWRLVPQSTSVNGTYFWIKLEGTGMCITGSTNALTYTLMEPCGTYTRQLYYAKADGTGWRFLSDKAGICLSQMPPGYVGVQLINNNCDTASAYQFFSLDVGLALDANGQATSLPMADFTDYDVIVSWTVSGVPYTLTNGITDVRGGVFAGDNVSNSVVARTVSNPSNPREPISSVAGTFAQAP
ncbi:hypothetical protein HYH03_001447 [Edaphochlamys debaryana]|uniref:Ricin B lectin domain-containing protein n=1 Tax=Edaphochlamys debaryana TaxID=47281 RepID=A0A836C4Z0_9CHLO|nr:hypothetical protein HYH03_001447 [Edaphochlamys debaryana]|eukprot:KAG2500681.1 hypothetical protein HYH03_001447 [Edaphochlamys debaryana]